MAATYKNLITVDVEVTIMSGLGGLPHAMMFRPENPFIQRSNLRPLPIWEQSKRWDTGAMNHINLYTVVEEEFTIYQPEFNLKKAFNCFNNLPSAGAKYSIKLCVDVPDNKNPMLLPPTTGSETGHTFIVLTKRNGTSDITQVFGFYSQKHPGYWNPLRAMPSTIRNNQLREINASIEMSLTPAQFEMIQAKALELAKRKYALADYNCTNYGLDLFNAVRSKPITVESYKIYLPDMNNWSLKEPNHLTIDVTVQKLFKKLNEMKSNKDSEASLITIDKSNKTIAPASTGVCN